MRRRPPRSTLFPYPPPFRPLEGKGIRCVSDRPWITAAETCECLLAYLSVGRRDFALELFQQAQSLRSEEGYYWTRSEEHTSELQSRQYLVCRLLLEKKKETH